MKIDMENLVDSIQGELKVILLDEKAYTGIAYGLAMPVTELEPYTGPSYTHYGITSGENCESPEEALTNFMVDLHEKGPYEGDIIFWRLKPEMNEYKDFGFPSVRYKVDARFSIGVEV